MQQNLIGNCLVKLGYLSLLELEKVLEIQDKKDTSFESILISKSYINEINLLKFITNKLNLDYTDNPGELHNGNTSTLISEVEAKEYGVLPLFIKEGTLFYATSEVLDERINSKISFLTGLKAIPVLSPRESIEEAITVAYGYEPVYDELLEGVEVSDEDQELLDRVASAPVVKMVNSLIKTAYSDNASDLHINPEESYSSVRLRVDGDLRNLTQLRKDMHDPMVTRIKILAGMNIAEMRIPQDGAFTFIEDGISVDIRVASIPTKHGEKLVLRLLGSDQSIDYDLDKLDFDDHTLQMLRKVISIPNGIILITGPTGSGKTTTLYALLKELSTSENGVVTIEDPVEKYFEGITQVQINPKAGLTFASGLRSILRLDPDVIMLGEIRDTETADSAIRAAITGHIVLSTLHTNDALSSITRLVNMDIEPYMVAAAVRCVIAQRLVRKLCSHCKVSRSTTNDERILLSGPKLLKTYGAVGCEHCNQSGYLGRKAIFELIPIDQYLQEMISEGASYSAMKDYVINQQRRPLLKDDVVRILKGGDTSINEVRKVLFNNEIFID